jgi:alanyl-tRNA synthetase
MKSSEKFNLKANIGKILKTICVSFGGKGGGRHNLATGSINDVINLENLEECVKQEMEKI